MFESWGAEKQSVRMVQPMLAIVVHAAVIAWAVGDHPTPQVKQTHTDRSEEIFVLPGRPSDPGTATHHGSPDGLVPNPIPRPGLPPGPVTPVSDLRGLPSTLPGPIDPRSLVAPGMRTDSAPSGSLLWGEGQVSDPPQLLKLSEPAYPETLRRAGIEGTVNVTYIVDPSGYVEAGSVQIVSSDHPAFAESVRDALGRARFTPGRLHGRAVRVLVRQTFRFATQS
jgi:protein TonB